MTGPVEGRGYLSGDELAAAAGISADRLERLIRLGLVEPATPGGATFPAAAAARLRRMVRLHADLGVNLAGAAIIVDLVIEVERLQSELVRRAKPSP